MPPIWILEESLDGGKTWRVSQPYQVYKRKDRPAGIPASRGSTWSHYGLS